MVSTDEKRRRRFLQGLNLGIQRSLATARFDSYAELVELAQKVEECESKWKDFQSTKWTGPRNWRNVKGSSSQGQARQAQRGTGSLPQKRAGEASASAPVKRGASQTTCFFCGLSGHREADCWRKAGKCLICESAEHQIKDCPKARGGTAPPTANVLAPRERPAVAENLRW